ADDFVSALDQMSRGLQRRGLRIVVSDFLDGAAEAMEAPLDAPPPWERAMKRLSGRHQVLAVEVSDPRERELPDVGVVWLTDPESGAVREVDTGDPGTRARYAEAAARHRERVRVALRRAGVAHLELSTDRDWVADLARFVLAHRRVAMRLHSPPARGTGS
ncbi:MAG TPA: DUF58 domain-containing protein, partial [Actinopolymorphaceae bacterium]